MTEASDPRPSRRSFLAASAAVALALAACGDDSASTTSSTSTSTLPPTTVPTTAPPTTVATGPATFVATGPATPAQVALTFHTSGDLGIAGQLLDLLAARHVPITSFIVGEWLEANPTWAQRLVSDGHELANHTYSHVTFGELAPDAMATEIDRCRDLLIRLTGSGGTLFRPSGTADGVTSPSDTVLAVAGTSGYRTVLGFDVDPLDYQDPGEAAVRDRVLGTVHPGAIVSLHFDHAGTLAALPAILDGIAAKGLTPVTASRLLTGA